jgi:hypothetical protein
LRSNTKGYGGKTHYTDSQNSDTTASNGRELYHLQLSVQAAIPETFGYTLVVPKSRMLGDIPPLPKYAFMAYSLLKAGGQIYLYISPER